MILKVDHDELYDVTKILKNDREDYRKEIDNMLAQIEKLKLIWHGEDAEIFCSKAFDYIQNMKKISNAMGQISAVGDKANAGYAENDESFGKQLETEANNYGEDDVNV